MGRPARTASTANWHHVMNRGARRLPVFGDEDDHQFFLRLVGEAVGRCDVRVHAYVLMGNHFHLLVEAPACRLGAAMKHIGEHFTRRFNAKYGLDGPLFRGRYRSKPIESERYLLQVLRYIHRNPVEHGIGGLDHRWSSHNAYAGAAPGPTWLTIGALLGQLGSRDAYRGYLADASGDGTAGAFGERPTRVRPDTVEAVNRALGIASREELDLVRGSELRATVRLAAVLMAAEATGLSSADLAEHYGYRSGSGVRMAVRRARVRLDSDPAFARIVADARTRLAAFGPTVWERPA